MDHVQIKNHLLFQMFDERGTLVDRWECGNVMTELGEAYLADREGQSPPSQMSHLAIGTGTGQTAASTTLAAEVARVALDTGYPAQDTGANDNRVIYQATIPAGTGTGTITETAVFNSATTGTMLQYASGFSKVKGAGNSLLVTLYMRLGVT